MFLRCEKMRPWSKLCRDLSVLVDSYFQNDPYFPRPHDGGTMYKNFRQGYIQAYPQTDDGRGLAQAFLKAIEEKDGIFLEDKGQKGAGPEDDDILGTAKTEFST